MTEFVFGGAGDMPHLPASSLLQFSKDLLSKSSLTSAKKRKSTDWLCFSTSICFIEKLHDTWQTLKSKLALCKIALSYGRGFDSREGALALMRQQPYTTLKRLCTKQDTNSGEVKVVLPPVSTSVKTLANPNCTKNLKTWLKSFRIGLKRHNE